MKKQLTLLAIVLLSAAGCNQIDRSDINKKIDNAYSIEAIYCDSAAANLGQPSFHKFEDSVYEYDGQQAAYIEILKQLNK